METSGNIITLGGRLSVRELIEIARGHAKVAFSKEYCDRVNRSRALVEKWVDEGRVMYGVTTGFGALCSKAISREDTAKLQENILLSHSVSVGEPFTEEEARAVMVMVLQNLGQGYSGVRLLVLEQYRQFLNRGLTPWAPKEGSVGYLSPEAHMALVLIGRGKAYYRGELLEGKEALSRAGLSPITLAAKEGLALVSGTTSPTALACLGLYDMIKAARSADVIGAMTLEVSGGLLNAFDERVMKVRPHPEQAQVAKNVRDILAGSELMKKYAGTHVQDALSLRCIPQLHGSACQMLKNALDILETEVNSCCDNPIIWPEEGHQDVISACNADASYVGMAMDSACIASVGLAKMSERRNNRLIDGSLSGLPWFIIKNPGLSSGLMIPQYAQAGLLNDMRTLSTSATIDNVPTCGNQEDYVSMGYNATKKSILVAEKLEYILAIELLSAYEGQQFRDPSVSRSPVTQAVIEEIEKHVPILEQDQYLYPYIVYLRNFIHSGELIRLVEEKLGREL